MLRPHLVVKRLLVGAIAAQWRRRRRLVVGFGERRVPAASVRRAVGGVEVVDAEVVLATQSILAAVAAAAAAAAGLAVLVVLVVGRRLTRPPSVVELVEDGGLLLQHRRRHQDGVPVRLERLRPPHTAISLRRRRQAP